MAQWLIAPVIDWLMHKGRHLPTREEVVSGICERVRAEGMPIDRVAFFFWTLHPQYAGVALFWDGEKVTLNRGEHGFQRSEQYLNSPAARIREGERVIRRRLEQRDCALDFPVLHDLRAQGMTDYVMAEVLFSDATRNSVSLTTRRPGGFVDHDIAEIQRLLHPFALIMENFNSRELARTLLETYLGRISGAKVLDGQIKRGDGILDGDWFSDLRESTALSISLGEQRFSSAERYSRPTPERARHASRCCASSRRLARGVPDSVPATRESANASPRGRAARSRCTPQAPRSGVRAARIACGVGLHLGRCIRQLGPPERLEYLGDRCGPPTRRARIDALARKRQEVVLPARWTRSSARRPRLSNSRWRRADRRKPRATLGLRFGAMARSWAVVLAGDREDAHQRDGGLGLRGSLYYHVALNAQNLDARAPAGSRSSAPRRDADLPITSGRVRCSPQRPWAVGTVMSTRRHHYVGAVGGSPALEMTGPPVGQPVALNGAASHGGSGC